MKLTTTKVVSDNVYKSTLQTEPDGLELGLIDKFGEPDIEVGGSFTGPPSFTLPNQTRKLNSGFPYSFQLDADGDVDAKDKVNVWSTEVRARMITALTALESNVDDFTSDSSEII